MHLAGWDGAARVRSPRLLQSGPPASVWARRKQEWAAGEVKQVALRRAMDLCVCGNFPRPSLGNPCVRVVVTSD